MEREFPLDAERGTKFRNDSQSAEGLVRFLFALFFGEIKTQKNGDFPQFFYGGEKWF